MLHPGEILLLSQTCRSLRKLPRIPFKTSQEYIYSASSAGALHLLQLHDRADIRKNMSSIVLGAVCNDHLPILQWSLPFWSLKKWPRHWASLAWNAGRCGRRQILEWAIQVPIPAGLSFRCPQYHEVVGGEAGGRQVLIQDAFSALGKTANSVELAEWCFQQGYDPIWDTEVCRRCVVCDGSLPMLQWARSKPVPAPWCKQVCEGAAC